jgi:TusA-related sulfurtransferase
MNDDPAVVLDVVAWCKSTHHELLGILKDDRDVYYCYVRKASAPPRRFEPPTR